MTMAGWLMAMQLAELCPKKKTSIYTIGYSVGGYTYNDNIYGYQFRSDPNVARLVASGIYACLRSPDKLNPNISKYRGEVSGTTYSETLQEIYDRTHGVDVGTNDLYVDLRKFMNCAPGPYDPAYSYLTGDLPTFPDTKASNKCLQLDMDIYNYVIQNFNLSDTSDPVKWQRTVQAIADKDAEPQHTFGYDQTGVCEKYDFHAVFGEETIGKYISPSGKIASFFMINLYVGSTARKILQDVATA